MGNQIEAITSQIFEKYDKIDAIIENKWIETAGELSAALKITKFAFERINNYRFGCFIKGLSTDESVEDSLNKLNQLINNPKFTFFVVSEIEKVYSSNSLLCNFIRGILLSKITNSTDSEYLRKCLEIELMLQNFTDYDIYNLVHIINFIQTINSDRDIIIDGPWELKKWCEEQKIDSLLLFSTLNKMGNTNVLYRDFVTMTDISVDDHDEPYYGKSYDVNGEVETFMVYKKTDNYELIEEIIINSKDIINKYK